MADTAHGAEAGNVGMPQLDFTTFPSQIFWLVVALTVLYYVLSRAALPRIAGAIEERQDAIEDDLDRAAEFKRRAHQAEQAYEAALAAARAEVARITAEARAEVQAEVHEVVAKAEADIAAKAAESEKRIAEVRAEAAENVRSVARETAAALIGAVLPGTSVSDADIAAAVDARSGS